MRMGHSLYGLDEDRLKAADPTVVFTQGTAVSDVNTAVQPFYTWRARCWTRTYVRVQNAMWLVWLWSVHGACCWYTCALE